MKLIVAVIFLIVSLCSQSVLSYDDVNFQKVPTPSWVENRILDTTFDAPTELISSGTFYRIVDDQIRVSASSVKHYYTRMTQTIINKKGLDSSSQIQIHFDPTYQSLLIHDISIIRNGQRTDRYHSSDISVFHSEEDYEQRIYNGTMMFNAILDDVSVGDTVDYSYSIIGSNPIYKDIFSTSRTLVWNVPVQDQYHRVLWGKSNKLYINQRNGSVGLTEKQHGEYKDYSVHVKMADPLRYSSQSPSWYLPRHSIDYTETENWKQVNEWALGLYRDLGINAEVKDVATSIRNLKSTPKEQLALALSFVQENIRYVGIEIGDNSHLPTSASETLRLKYGDCKDKSVLMLAIMKELGITGYPALVNSEIGQSLNDMAPSITRFDHVIVTAVISGEIFWLDPTMSNQVGLLESIYQPDYGYALVVRTSEESLIKMNPPSVSDIKIEETYTIPADVTDPVTLQVATKYLGWQAQSILSRYQSDGTASISEQYQEYYQRSLSGAKSLKPVEIATDRESGWVVLNEHYHIDNAFTEADDGYKLNFYANDIRNELIKPKDISRNAPFIRAYPMKITNRIVLKFLEDGWDFEDENFSEDNAYFSYTKNIKFIDKTLTLEYQYQAKKDHVPADEINAYLDARERAREQSSYSIIKYKPRVSTVQNEAAESNLDATENFDIEVTYILWYMGAAGVLFCLMLIDWRFFAVARNDADSLWFQPVSIAKFYFLGLLTFGMYCSYWVYRNWLLIDKREKLGIWPIARGIFSVFWLYPLYLKLSERQRKLDNAKPIFSKYLAVFLATSYFILSVVSGFVENVTISIFVSAITPLIFIPLLLYINRLYSEESAHYFTGSKVGFRHVCVILICLPILLLSVLQMAYLTPTGTVIKGEDLWSHDIDFMQRESILNESENIEYFYSDSLFSNRNDGNGFTERTVFSYWIDEESGFIKASANYDEIKDFEIEYAESDEENTTVKVVRKDGTDFLLYISAVNKKDRVFTDSLLRIWKSQSGSVLHQHN